MGAGERPSFAAFIARAHPPYACTTQQTSSPSKPFGARAHCQHRRCAVVIVAGELKETERLRDELIGQRCGDSFEIVKLLGVGGMGAVYMAQSARLGRRAAVKVLLRELTNPASIARFLAEAFAAGSINDPAHVVDILDTGELRGGRHYMLLEYCDGGSLEALLAKSGPLPFDQVISIATPICLALASAHSIHIVHRDVKPGNILFRIDRGVPRAKLGDFGLAKLLEYSRLQLTAPFTILGSPGYMSPEQCDPRSDIDGRTDIYALGRVLYEMVTGRLPYPCESARDAIQLTSMNAPFPRPSELRPNLPPALDAAIMACLEPNRNRRIADANEVLWRLNPCPIAITSSPAAMTMSSPVTIGMPPAAMALGSTPAAAMTIASSPATQVVASSPVAVTIPAAAGATAWSQARSDLEPKSRARALVFILGVVVGIALVGWIALAIAR